MIKKLLSLLLVFVLLLSAISCTGLWPYTNHEQEPDTDNEQEHKEDDEKIGQGMGQRRYTATYEEVKNAVNVINERGTDVSKNKIVLLDSFVNEYEIAYYFIRFGSLTDPPQSLEKFYTAPKFLDDVSWNAVLYFGECSHEGESHDHRHGDYLIPLKYEKHKSSVILSWGGYTISEANDPSLWTVEKDSRAETFDTFTYKFLYDGKVIHRVFSCFELDDGMLEKFREDIINAYLPAAE